MREWKRETESYTTGAPNGSWVVLKNHLGSWVIFRTKLVLRTTKKPFQGLISWTLEHTRFQFNLETSRALSESPPSRPPGASRSILTQWVRRSQPIQSSWLENVSVHPWCSVRRGSWVSSRLSVAWDQVITRGNVVSDNREIILLQHPPHSTRPLPG
jgi:hypothetical protein